MAVIALVAQSFFMGRSFRVAVNAIMWCAAVKPLGCKVIHHGRFIISLARGMTAGARQLFVGAAEFEIGQFMVKGFRVKHQDIGLTTFVIGMAMAAFATDHQGAESVKAGFPVQVCGDKFVAGETKISLFAFFERFVTALALLLILSMRLNQRAGHDELL